MEILMLMIRATLLPYLIGFAMAAAILSAKGYSPRKVIIGTIFCPITGIVWVLLNIKDAFRKLYNGIAYNAWERKK